MQRRGCLRHGVNVGGQLVAVELAAERNRACGGLRVGQASRRIAFPEHALVADRVVVRRAAEILRRDLLQLLLRVHRAGVIRARHRVRRLAADREAGPRQALARVAPVDDDLVPRHLEHVGGDAREIDHRMRAEIADAGLHVQLAVGPDRHQSVEADRAGARAGRPRRRRRVTFDPLPLAGARRARRPIELLRAAIERLLHERARDVAASAFRIGRPVERFALGRIHPANRHLIDPELLGGLRDHAFADAVGLHRSRRSLLRARRRVRQHVDRAPAHRRRLIDQRRRVAGRSVIAHRPVRTAVLDDEEIEREDLAVLRKAGADAAGHVGARAADVAFFLAADAHHHRRVGLLREQRGNRHRHGAAALAAESAAGVLADQDDVFRLDADPSRDRINRAHDALGGAVQVELAVLPERHRAARFHRMMAGRGHDERFIDAPARRS